jgi:hypothetical protein
MSGWTSSPFPVASIRALTDAISVSSVDIEFAFEVVSGVDSGADAGDWLTRGCDCELGFVLEASDWFTVTDGRGVLNAPVELRWSRSYSSCSFGGSRGGAGPTEKAGRLVVVVNRRREGRRSVVRRRRGILV